MGVESNHVLQMFSLYWHWHLPWAGIKENKG